MVRAKGLDELKKLAFPALHHVELVALAKEHSPNKAQELASGRWPRRQVRACRFLAMIRRDFSKAFQVFINQPLEQARPGGPVRSTLKEEKS